MITVEHNEIFDLAFRFVTETSENIFLTGKAGTGKTTFLKYLKETCSKNIVVAAPTGVAAINAGGVTLHSLFQLPFHPFIPTKNNREELLAKIRYNKQRQQLLRKMELLVIDEISMVRCDVMDAIDTILKSIRRNHQLPFGGVQVLFIGDLHQLSPVAQNQEWGLLNEYYESPFFFDSLAVKEQMPLLIELDKIYRQKEDFFVTLLNKVRNNNMSDDDFNDLHDRFIPDFHPDRDENYITLTSHNKQADQINQQELHKLHSSTFSYLADVEGEFPEHINPAEAELELKEGAQVMFLKNDPILKRFFNGKIGIVTSLEDDNISVDCDGDIIFVPKETWENTRYTLNRDDGKLEQEIVGTFTQYPLRLAWAITIHKSQGLTFDKVMIDAGSAFSSGQVYVALSRCTSLEGIVLLSKIPSSAIYSNENVIKGQQLLSHKGSLAERFAGARQAFTQQLLEDLFSFNEAALNCNQLLFQIKQHQDKLNKDALEWIEKLKTQILADQSIGQRFITHISELMKEENVIEKNQALQKRISDAAYHFLPTFISYKDSIKNHPLITEHKESATPVNESLQNLLVSIHTVVYYLDYCKQAFSITSFLQHKLNFSLPKVNLTCYASGKEETIIDTSNVDLYSALKIWRNKTCADTDQPIYMVANQASLQEIATYLPLNKKDLMHIRGFGKAKAEKFGDEILDIVEIYCQSNNLKTNIFSKEGQIKKEQKPKSKTAKIDTKAISLSIFKEGNSVKEIADFRKLTLGTIENHLIHFIETGEVGIAELLSLEKQNLIKEATEKFGDSGYKVLMEKLPEGISYNEIRMVLASKKGII